MRTTLALDDELVKEAQCLTGTVEKIVSWLDERKLI